MGLLLCLPQVDTFALKQSEHVFHYMADPFLDKGPTNFFSTELHTNEVGPVGVAGAGLIGEVPPPGKPEGQRPLPQDALFLFSLTEVCPEPKSHLAFPASVSIRGCWELPTEHS